MNTIHIQCVCVFFIINSVLFQTVSVNSRIVPAFVVIVKVSISHITILPHPATFTPTKNPPPDLDVFPPPTRRTCPLFAEVDNSIVYLVDQDSSHSRGSFGDCTTTVTPLWVRNAGVLVETGLTRVTSYG